MSLFDLPVDVKDELLVLKRDVSDPAALRNVLRRGHKLFHLLYVEAFPRVEVSLAEKALGDRFRGFLSRASWVRGEVWFHVDFRCRAHRDLWRAHRYDPYDPDALSSLIRLELTHSKLKDASMHVFQARRLGAPVPELDLFEEELESCLADDLEAELWGRIGEAEARLRRAPEDAKLLADLAADYFYEVLDLRRAASLIDHALAAGHDDPETWFLGAEIAFESGRPVLALERLERMVALDPCDYRGRMLRANVLASQGRAEDSLAALRGLVGRLDQPIRTICQDVFFQAPLTEHEEYHRIWLELLRRGQLAEDGVGYYYSAGTPTSFLGDTLRARRVFHRASLLTRKHREGDLVEEVDAGFRELLEEAPDYTFLLDEYARFLLSTAPSGSEAVQRANVLAEKAVCLAEAAGEPEARFRATLAAARQITR